MRSSEACDVSKLGSASLRSGWLEGLTCAELDAAMTSTISRVLTSWVKNWKVASTKHTVILLLGFSVALNGKNRGTAVLCRVVQLVE